LANERPYGFAAVTANLKQTRNIFHINVLVDVVDGIENHLNIDSF